MSQHLLQNHPRVQCHIFILVSLQRRKNHLPLFPGPAHVLHGRPPTPNLPPKEIIENLRNIFAGFKIEFGNMEDKEVEEIIRVSLVCELSDNLGQRVTVAKEEGFDLGKILCNAFRGLY